MRVKQINGAGVTVVEGRRAPRSCAARAGTRWQARLLPAVAAAGAAAPHPPAPPAVPARCRPPLRRAPTRPARPSPCCPCRGRGSPTCGTAAAAAAPRLRLRPWRGLPCLRTMTMLRLVMLWGFGVHWLVGFYLIMQASALIRECPAQQQLTWEEGLEGDGIEVSHRNGRRHRVLQGRAQVLRGERCVWGGEVSQGSVRGEGMDRSVYDFPTYLRSPQCRRAGARPARAGAGRRG